MESKRGGGGYIRIGKVQFSDHHQMLRDLLASIKEQISQQVFTDILQMLFEKGLITGRELDLFWVTTTDSVLGSDAARIRARLLQQLLKQLDRKGN